MSLTSVLKEMHVVFPQLQSTGNQNWVYLNSHASLGAQLLAVVCFQAEEKFRITRRIITRNPTMCPLLPWALHYCGLVGLASTQVREWKHDFFWGGGTGGHVGQFGQGHWISSHHSFKSEMWDRTMLWISQWLWDMIWVVPRPSNSHHQNYYIFSRGSL